MKQLLCSLWCVLVCLSGSLGWGGNGREPRVEVLTKTSASLDGSPFPEYPRGKPEVTILRITIPPGAQLPLHTHPVINAGVLLRGTLTVITEDHKTFQLNAGDPIVEVVQRWHYGKNEGSEPAEIIVFYAGIQDVPITIRQDKP